MSVTRHRIDNCGRCGKQAPEFLYNVKGKTYSTGDLLAPGLYAPSSNSRPGLPTPPHKGRLSHPGRLPCHLQSSLVLLEAVGLVDNAFHAAARNRSNPAAADIRIDMVVDRNTQLVGSVDPGNRAEEGQQDRRTRGLDIVGAGFVYSGRELVRP